MNKKLYIIAEAALSYHGNIDLCKLLLKSAKIGAANAIKFQVMYANDICIQPYQYYDLFKTMEMLPESWQLIRNLAKENDLGFIADVFGEKSFEIAESIGTDGYKIHTTIFNEKKLVKKIILTNKRIFLSTGGLTNEEIQEFCKEFVELNPNICLLFGYQAEPTEIDKNYLLRIPYLRKTTGLEVGFMDHIDANSPYKYALSHVALGLGVTTFEKHIALCRNFKFENYVSSLTPEEFKFYSQSLRDLYFSLGEKNSVLELSKEEDSYRKKTMKKIIAAKNIEIGNYITNSDIDFKRSDACEEGFFTSANVVNKIAKKPIYVGQIITKDLIADEK